MTVEEVVAIIQRQTSTINVATVYRTLDFLVKEGLAYRADLGDNRVIYATTSHGSHIHLVCRQCGQVIDADSALLDELDAQLRRVYEFSADLVHVSLPGLCRECRIDDPE
jgi:Fur family ferric uptake transcriptional regulator